MLGAIVASTDAAAGPCSIARRTTARIGVASPCRAIAAANSTRVTVRKNAMGSLAPDSVFSVDFTRSRIVMPRARRRLRSNSRSGGCRSLAWPSAIRQRRLVELCHKCFACRGKLWPQPAPRPQHAGAAILSEALHHGKALLEMPHDLSNRYRLRSTSECQAATPATLAPNETAAPQVADHLRQMVLRDRELVCDRACRHGLFRRSGQTHQNPEAEVGERSKSHEHPFRH